MAVINPNDPIPAGILVDSNLRCDFCGRMFKRGEPGEIAPMGARILWVPRSRRRRRGLSFHHACLLKMHDGLVADALRFSAEHDCGS